MGLPNFRAGEQIKANEMNQAFANIVAMGDFSLEETDTGIRWVDNKRIFKKTYSIGGGVQAPVRNEPHGLPNGVGIVGVDAFSVDSFTGTYRKLPYCNTSLSELGYVMAEADPVNISIYSAKDRPSWHFYVTLYYTKSSGHDPVPG